MFAYAVAPHPDPLPANGGERGNVVLFARHVPYAGAVLSSLHFPRRDWLTGLRVLAVLQLDAHGGKLVADAVALGPVLRLPRSEAGVDQLLDAPSLFNRR